MTDRLPDFFMVGAPKCATTSMDDYLAQHPQIFMSPVKESHMFATDLYPPGTQCFWERYCGFFEGVRDERRVGESSVFYMLSRTAARALHDFRPDARILVMLRNPLDVLESHHSQIRYEGLEDEPDLTRALAREAERKAAVPPERAIYRERVLHYRDVVDFAPQLARFRDTFGAERVHVVLFDDLTANPAREYARVLDFLGVDTTFVPRFERKNANKSVRFPALRTLLYETPDSVSRASRVVLPTRRGRVAVREWLKRLNTRYEPRAGMPPALRREMAEQLRPGIERLSAMLDRDLTPWLDDRPLTGFKEVPIAPGEGASIGCPAE